METSFKSVLSSSIQNALNQKAVNVYLVKEELELFKQYVENFSRVNCLPEAYRRLNHLKSDLIFEKSVLLKKKI